MEKFTPRKLPTIGTAKKNCDSSTAAQKGLVYEELNGLLGLQRRGFESVAGFLDTSPNKRCELEGNCRAYSNGNEASPGSSPHVLNSPHPCYHGLDVQCKPLSRKMKFLCSFGGRIVPRTNDGRLRYVGGETRIISIRKNLTYNELVKKTRAICNHPHTIKYLLTGEDLDALISVTSDEDLHNMIEEFHNPEHLTDSNACWEDATSKRRVSKNTNFATQSIMLEQSHALNSNARGSIGNIATSVSRDRASLNLLDPRASDISLHNSASGAPFREDIAVCLDMSNGKQKEQSSDGISNPKHVSGKDTFFEFQLSDNTNCSGVPKMSIIVQDATDNLSPDGHPSSHVAPHEQYEPNKKLQPIGKIREADSVCQEPDYKDDKVVGDHEGYSISDATGVETEAGLYGFQIIRNSDLEELRELGSGTFGTVHHGKWRGTDVAIKMIKKSCFTGRLSEQEQLTKDFWREAQILSQLHHPNVVAFYGVVPDGPGGTMATVTEYMANGSLRHVLLRKDRTLDRRKKLMIALDAAFGMEYLHMKNIVHFDLKCENLLVNLGDPQRPVCKVGDFGLSRIKRKTLVSGGVRGTLPWMAPELLNGSNSRVSGKVDVFSFGITMWEILTGEEPFASMHCGEIIGGIVNNNLRPPIPQRCDSEWRKLMEDCWASDPGARPSFTEIKNRLRAMSSAFQPKTRALVADPALYRSIVGALQYLTFTRPDISYSVQQLCLHLHAPRDVHVTAMKRVLSYLRGTSTYEKQSANSSRRSSVFPFAFPLFNATAGVPGRKRRSGIP
ncbi:unnamed protein product [Cuscuta campestris]|uniref:Protein kinase domain-containing protein n=1 Tax=Cuscuta campestris TaxID=132261 RepID=A0A484NLC6_9ASTE|nr:unnamed protein product [Cuscuta campestris]